jgi:hypothetical protein
MKLSLIVRGQHPPDATAQHLHDDLELVRRADRLGFDGIVKRSHFSSHPFDAVQQIRFWYIRCDQPVADICGIDAGIHHILPYMPRWLGSYTLILVPRRAIASRPEAPSATDTYGRGLSAARFGSAGDRAG